MQQKMFTKKVFGGKTYVFGNGNPESMFAGCYGEGIRTNRPCKECKNGTLYAFDKEFVCRRCGSVRAI